MKHLAVFIALVLSGAAGQKPGESPTTQPALTDAETRKLRGLLEDLKSDDPRTLDDALKDASLTSRGSCGYENRRR